jgi:predicted esterase
MRYGQPCVAALVLIACTRASGGPVGRLAEPMPLPAAPAPPAEPSAPLAAPVALPSEEAPPRDTQIAFSPEGAIGAWLFAGPLDSQNLDESPPRPRLHTAVGPGDYGPSWRLAATSRGPLDLGAMVEDVHGSKQAAYLGGVLHLGTARRVLIFLGVDGDFSLSVDGRRLLAREHGVGRIDDDEVVAADLDPGDHQVVLAVHRSGPAWAVRVRMVDADLRPLTDARWALPGAGADDGEWLVRRMATVKLDRGLGIVSYQPVLRAHFFEGAPIGIDVPIDGAVIRAVPGAESETLATGRSGDASAGVAGEGVLALPELSAAAVEDGDWIVRAEFAGSKVDFSFRPRRVVREAIAHAERALASTDGTGFALASLDSVRYLKGRLAAFVSSGDRDLDAQRDDARELEALAAALERGLDPYTGRIVSPSANPYDDPEPWRTGAMRRAYISPIDGHFSEFAVYVPPDFDENRTYPLIVALHGMNGHPLEMIMWLFGHDDPDRDGAWEDRHPRKDLKGLEAIVVAPDGHSNAMYRELGEDDVMRVVDLMMATYPIDPTRVTITGPSMGGIGAAACALHYPDRFAAAEPLCGYQSYFVRTDIAGRPLRPWERFIAEERSNVFWAENGLHVPLYIVHGTHDLPEENSGVLIDRYRELHYEVEHEHPELGHNVWQSTYEDLKGAQWLLTHRQSAHPRAVRFKTCGTRWADDAWVHVRELSSVGAWGQIIARIDEGNELYVATQGVSALALDRDSAHIDDALPVSVHIDGSTLVFPVGEPLELHRDVGAAAVWKAGPAVHVGPFKHGTVTGPIRDVFHEPIAFVWGASDPAQATANEEVARQWARVRPGVRVDYPVMSDQAFLAAGESIANDRALFLVGNAKSNQVLREIEAELPIRVEDDNIVLGDARVSPKSGELAQLGVVFIRPNPRRPDRYVVVVEGVGPLGTWRSLSLPDMLPDYVVFDGDVAAARGKLTLGAATVRAAGFFDESWALPGRSPH